MVHFPSLHLLLQSATNVAFATSCYIIATASNYRPMHSNKNNQNFLNVLDCLEKSQKHFWGQSQVSIESNLLWRVATMKQMIMLQMITNECTSIICFFATLSSLHAMQQVSIVKSLHRGLGLSPKVFLRFFSLKVKLKNSLSYLRSMECGDLLLLLSIIIICYF